MRSIRDGLRIRISESHICVLQINPDASHHQQSRSDPQRRIRARKPTCLTRLFRLQIKTLIDPTGPFSARWSIHKHPSLPVKTQIQPAICATGADQSFHSLKGQPFHSSQKMSRNRSHAATYAFCGAIANIAVSTILANRWRTSTDAAFGPGPHAQCHFGTEQRSVTSGASAPLRFPVEIRPLVKSRGGSAAPSVLAGAAGGRRVAAAPVSLQR